MYFFWCYCTFYPPPPPKVRDRVTVKCSLMLTITLTQTLGGYESAITAFCLESNYQLVPWLRKFEKAYQFIVYLCILRITGLMKLSVAAVNSISLQSSITKTPCAHFISLRGSLFLYMLNQVYHFHFYFKNQSRVSCTLPPIRHLSKQFY